MQGGRVGGACPDDDDARRPSDEARRLPQRPVGHARERLLQLAGLLGREGPEVRGYAVGHGHARGAQGALLLAELGDVGVAEALVDAGERGR